MIPPAAAAAWTEGRITAEGLITTATGIMNKVWFEHWPSSLYQSFGKAGGNRGLRMALMVVNVLSKLRIKHGDLRAESNPKVETKDHCASPASTRALSPRYPSEATPSCTKVV